MCSEYQLRRIAETYYSAKSFIIDQGFGSEVDWQYSVSLQNLDESTLLRETAWVVLCSGMRESVVRRIFASISEAFLDWSSGRLIAEHADRCAEEALLAFNHPGKIAAIVRVAEIVAHDGFPRTFLQIKEGGVNYLQQFPYLGPITSLHLAKNIGLPVAKPDRHLRRIADKLGYSCVQKLCEDIARATDEPVPVVDLVLWRYSTLRQQY
jgi:hypothetical protein